MDKPGTPKIIMRYWALPAAIFYFSLIIVFLTFLLIGLWLIVTTESTAGMLLGLGEVLIGFSATFFMVFRYRKEIAELQERVV